MRIESVVQITRGPLEWSMKLSRSLLTALLFCFLCSNAISAQTRSWLKPEKVGEGVWRIDDNGSDNMYLVVGTQKALLIDTGFGIGNLDRLVKTLTDKPLLVVNTHGHPDHASGNYQFKIVYADTADFDAIQKLSPEQSRKNFPNLGSDGTTYSDLVSVEQQSKASTSELIAAKDGFVFDLGGRKIEVIQTPGHTPGEIVLLDAANKQIFTGDNDNSLVWLFLPNSLPLESYLQSLKKLNGRAAEFSTIYPGHGGPMPNIFVAEQIGCVEGILNGSLPSETYHSFVGDARMSKFKSATVAFNPDNLRVKK